MTSAVPPRRAGHSRLSHNVPPSAKMSGIGALAASAIHSVAILLEEMEDTAINETVRDAVISQFNELTLDMRNLVTDVKEKIDTHMQRFPAGAQTNTATSQPSHVSRTYAEALVNPPSHDRYHHCLEILVPHVATPIFAGFAAHA